MNTNIFVPVAPGEERCLVVQTDGPLSAGQLSALYDLASPVAAPGSARAASSLTGDVAIVGPRLGVETSRSSNAVSICGSIGLPQVTRIETFRLYAGVSPADVPSLFDRMTEASYPAVPDSLDLTRVPEPVTDVPVLARGADALREANVRLGLGMDAWDIDYYTAMFQKMGRDPTTVECFWLAQANSEHCRHWFFRGVIVIDGFPMPKSLMELVREPLRLRGNCESVIAFSDNSSALKGFYPVRALTALRPGEPSPLVIASHHRHVIFTAETHNHPTMIAPYPGAETGTGGRIRDVQATGCGGHVVVGTAAFNVGSLRIPGYEIPGERRDLPYPDDCALPLQVLLQSIAGAWDYGNKFGEPVVNGSMRSFDAILPGGVRRAWVKPVMFTGGLGFVEQAHLRKSDPSLGMVVVQIGGPAYRVGFGGGSASSMDKGDNAAKLDFDSVQRGNAQMAQRVNRVVRACIEMGVENPILSAHDQGAGGPCNVVTEIIAPSGARISLRAIRLGDPHLSAMEIWGAEYQERLAFLLRAQRLDQFRRLCETESVPCEVLGEVTESGRIVVEDSKEGKTIVDMPLGETLAALPQKEFRFSRPDIALEPFRCPGDSPRELLRRVMRRLEIGSKGFATRHVDRSVTGLVAQQQCCGPLQLPVSDFAADSMSHFGVEGSATAQGEQPIMMLVDVKAGARMAVAEMFANLGWIVGTGDSNPAAAVKASWNWMWPAKLEGEGALVYDAMAAATQFVITIGGGEPDGGKDSLSMSAKVDGEKVKSPGQFIVSGYMAVRDVRRKVTPDLKKSGSRLMLLDLSGGHRRMGGSTLAVCEGQIGDECPDAEPDATRNAFNLRQKLLGEGLLLSGHDVGNGGLAVALAEMALAGNRGVEVALDGDVVPELFAEEQRFLFEVAPELCDRVTRIAGAYGFEEQLREIGKVGFGNRFTVDVGGRRAIDEDLPTLRAWWESTSDALDALSTAPACAAARVANRLSLAPSHALSFEPRETAPAILGAKQKPRVAIIRDVGSNGDREMAAAFTAAGFEAVDVSISHLVRGQTADLSSFRGVAFTGGFSHADEFGSAKGMAAIIAANPRVSDAFGEFRAREDTFSFGACNGCQLMALLGWVPGTHAGVEDQIHFVGNDSGRFESDWLRVRIAESPSVMLKGMAGSVLGVWVAHGEGKAFSLDGSAVRRAVDAGLAPVSYVDVNGNATDAYGWCPNGSPMGVTGLTSPDGRHLAMMPHPERAFRLWQMPYVPPEWEGLEAAPWLRLFQNAHDWCLATA